MHIKPFINNYNWEGIIYPSKFEDYSVICIFEIKKYVLLIFQKLIQVNQYMKSDKIPHIINADIKSSIKKIDKRKLKKW